MAEKQTANGGRSTSSTSKSTSKPSAPKKTATTSRTSASRKSASGESTSRASKSRAQDKSNPKRASTAKPRTRVTKKRPAIARRPNYLQQILTRLNEIANTVRNPDFWRNLAQKLPPWIDEVGALLLVVTGVVMLTALMNTSSQGAFANTVSDVLRRLFGDGSYLFSLGVIASGVIILLPKFGIVFHLGWGRLAAIETTFGAFLALLHLFANDPQPRALAQEGGGGGFIGWGLMEIVSSLGHGASVALFSILLAVGVTLALEIRLHHIVLAAVWLRTLLQRGINGLDRMTFDDNSHGRDNAHRTPREEENMPNGSEYNYDRARFSSANGVLTGNGEIQRRPSIVPREPSVALPDTSSKNAASEPLPGNPGQSTNGRRSDNPAANSSKENVPNRSTRQPEQSATGADSEKAARSNNAATTAANDRPLTKVERQEIIERARRSIGAANGRSLVAPGEPGERESVVPRELLPDTRAIPDDSRARTRQPADIPGERFFTVEDFREVKKIGKRSDHLPPLTLLSDIELNKPTGEEINTNAKIIRNTLLEFDVEIEVVDVHVGPTVTQYAVSPFTEQVTDDGDLVLNRVRVSEITNLGNDLALALSAKRLRIQAPVPGHSYVGIEVPNRQPSTVALRPVLESEHFYNMREKPLALPLGRDVSGEPFIADLAVMPHLLIAGTTGSGKSIMLAAMTTAFVMNNTPDRLRLVLLDPKMVELSRFNGLPHLLGPVETELDRIVGVLRWATREMERRYKLLEKEAARNIETFNNALGRRRKNEALPYIVIIVDEIGDLMMQRPDETERTLTRLAQMARAVGIHLMVATQRPSVDVITGLIKANFPARISFAVASGVDSRVILDGSGAETLMGRGDMLFLAPDAAGPRRIQGCYVSDEEVNDVVDYWRKWQEDRYEEDDDLPYEIAPWERGMTRREVLSETDPMLEDAIDVVVAEGEASASLIQRRLGLGYPRAARIIDMMHELGIVGAARPGGRTREVLVKPGTDPFKAIVDKRMKQNRKD